MNTVKEKAANIAASAISGKDKTNATAQEKVDIIRAKDNFEKEMATEHKDQRITEAELHKQKAQTHNLDVKEACTGTGTGTGAHHMSAIPGHGTGQPTGGHVKEACTGTGTRTGDHQMSAVMPGHDGTAVGSHPVEKRTGTGTRSTTAENRHVGGGATDTELTGTGYSG